MLKKPDRNALRDKRRRRVRKKIRGTAERPRLNVFRSLQNIYAQIIDDDRGVTLVSASTLAPELKGKLPSGGNTAAAAAVGELLAKKAIEAGIKRVVFDRAGYVYHGRVKALAEAARAGGLEF
ncbi:MAG: 50S ribosomal protein L18 [Pelotomaculum sp.]|uniref:Large ribosomal subunit protein uL18 n=1 Tax=Pelotomaculum thermopropionicum (strain DSM 13744 / JCM 10971 / SI) TaxID=370438 RepID=RL18_PELTS|nr:RecName: Full=Large ribosomal subunit protein uL18; AltName: Full=50S ribosomal protein L18 [Pelotomaculum thermopropionicum SI]NPV74436.1 50S ribosomal protein L18 [Pelotomaculum sp.]BAF58516.1 ribosomal protein L18 [Pelotomaculum thermopropionicum SI]